ncbi:MAG: flagellar type III secretion system pore protein FliP [Actinobacteria bacterium]|nr:flagellar type III secretion system pore protein FliP [Actinomycetota bacterium]
MADPVLPLDRSFDRTRARRSSSKRTFARLVFVVAIAFVAAGLGTLLSPGTALAAGSAPAVASAAPAVAPTPPEVPEIPDVSDPFDRPTGNTGTPGVDEGDSSDASIDVNFPNVTEESSNSVVIILLLTVLSIAPSLLVLCTSFTRIVIVLSLTRNALGIPTVPPQQVVVGLSLFLTLFVMGPTLSEMKEVALDPLLAGEITTGDALDAAQGPLREFLLAHTREGELEMFLDASKTETPVARDEVPLNALIPAFVLSELKSGFIIGFVIFIPFLIIDLVVSAVLMGLGMMMLPPSFVSLPFKLLLFVMLDGWMLVVGTLLTSYG